MANKRRSEQSTASFSRPAPKKQKTNCLPTASDHSQAPHPQELLTSESSGHVARAGATQRLSLLVQLASELQSDGELRRACEASGSSQLIEAAKTLSSVVRSSPQLVSSLYQTSISALESNLPTVPTLSAHFAKNPTSLPVLPPIQDSHLETIVFTCKGALGATAGLAQHANDSYERLEVLGDAYIEVIATRLIFARYPKSHTGWLVGVREGLVNNETLARYSMAYNFDQRATIPTHYAQGGVDMRKTWVKTMGDIFEAYVAAVIEADPENGFATAEKWLSNLWAPKLPSQNSGVPENTMAKQELAQKILSAGIKLDYMEEEKPKKDVATGKDTFSMGVYLTGWGWTRQHLGSGKGPGKAVAGTHAAMDALLNPLTAQVSAVKRAHYEKKKAEESPVEVT